MRKQIFFIAVLIIFGTKLIAQTILGIDVYNGTGSITWSSVAADGKVFAWAKATEGMTFTDASFSTNITNGSNAGVVMGAYHFARPDNNSPQEDADNFLNVVRPYYTSGQACLPPALDLEDPSTSIILSNLITGTALTTWVEDWLDYVYQELGVAPIVYTNSNYAGYLTSALNTSTYKLWIAKPNTSPTTPPTNLGVWTDWLFKQYSWTGSVSGISGAVDLNVFNGTLSNFNSLTCGNCLDADLIVQSKQVTPTTVMASGDVNAAVTTSNQGQSASDTDSDVGYYLSTNSTYDANDIELSTDELSIIQAGGSESDDDDVTIPCNTAPGTYYIIFYVDNNEQTTSECDENNNYGYVQITVTAAPPSFTLSTNAETVPSDNGVISIFVNGSNTCEWTASESCSWISISTPTGVGGDRLTMDFDENTNYDPRTCNITVGGETFVLTQDGHVGINEQQYFSFLIYPNPSTGSFTIQLETRTEEEIQVRVMNLLGQLVYQTNSEKIIGKYLKSISLNDVICGVYLVRVKVGEEFANQKIIVR